MSGRWRLLLSGPVPAVEAMAVDEALLLHGAIPTLRLYRWEPHGVSLGYFQRAADFPWDRFAREGVPVVRRLTGGGAIFHGDEITFSITAPLAHPLLEGTVLASYGRVHGAIAFALSRLLPDTVRVSPRGKIPIRSDVAGSPWCFHESTAFDLAAGGTRAEPSSRGKIVGSAQRRTGGRVLHHGSIVLRVNRFTPEVASVESLGGDPDPERAEEVLARALGVVLGPESGRIVESLAPAEAAAAARLAAERYANDAWTRRR